jgi:quercetin dioxygenase-like cupin family protein
VSGAAVVRDIRSEVEVPRGGILSRTVHADEHASLTLFAFVEGQELTSHTASRAAIIEVLEGEAEIGVGEEVHALGVGGWVALPPRAPHSVRATTPVKLALLLLGRA